MDPNSIFSKLKFEIECGALAPGSVLKQESVAERFGVSRQPVRHAFDQMLATGLLVRRPDRSLAVAKHSESEAADLAELRAILEIAALQLSGPKLNTPVFRRAERLSADILDEEDPKRIEELDREFHLTLYGSCGNARLLGVIDEFRRESRRAYHSQQKGGAEREELYREHVGLLAACAAGNFDAAASILRHHLTNTTARLLSSSKKDR